MRRASRLNVRIAVGLLCAFGAATATAAPTLDPDPARLARGEFVWHPEVSPAGPIVLVVSLDEQRAYVYRNGIAIGASTISSGRKGHETPTGVFTILQKEIEHYSNKYDDAPMPYMERLTWDGIALHGGSLPGYPASHGCIRLPPAFARKLYDITVRGITVVVARQATAPSTLVHPAMLAPVASNGSLPDGSDGDADFTWTDAPMATGPISILLSTADRRVFVFRNGRRIGSARYSGESSAPIGGSVLYVMSDELEYGSNTLDPARPRHRWNAYPLPTRAAPAPQVEALGRYHVPPAFLQRVYDVLTPGTTVLATDLPSVRSNVDSRSLRVLESSTPATKVPHTP